MSFLREFDQVDEGNQGEGNLKMGIVSSVSNNKAYVKINGSSEPIGRGAFIPKGQNILAGEKVLVGFIGGAWWVINVY